jgi:ABC-type molybdate transport system permease subunit
MLPLHLPHVGQVEGISLIIFILIVIIWSIALVAIANGHFYDNTTKLCWFLIVLILNVLGILLFILWGRKEIDYGSNTSSKPGI